MIFLELRNTKKSSAEISLDSVLHSFSTAGYLLSDQEVFLVLRAF